MSSRPDSTPSSTSSIVLASKHREQAEKQAAAEARKQKEEAQERAEAEAKQRRWERHYTSEDNGLKEGGFEVYYCAYCGAYVMILDVPLHALPVRKTDQSRVVNEEKHTMKRYMDVGQTKAIKRPGGIEKQYRSICRECGLALYYRPVPDDKPTKFGYILADALTNDPLTVTQKRDDLAWQQQQQQQEQQQQRQPRPSTTTTSTTGSSSSSASSSTRDPDPSKKRARSRSPDTK